MSLQKNESKFFKAFGPPTQIEKYKIYFRYLHDKAHYMICIDRENSSIPYVALKSKLMTAQTKDWSMDDAVRLLQRFIDSLDEDLSVVRDYTEKIKIKLESKKDDPDFTRMQGFFLLSMCLSRPHQLAFDNQMRMLKDTRPASSLMEPFHKKMKQAMVEAQRKYATGDSKSLPLGDLSKAEFRKMGLIAAGKMKPIEKKQNVPKDSKKGNQTKKQTGSSQKNPGNNQTKKTNPPAKNQAAKNTSTDSTTKKSVENGPAPKKAKKTKVPPGDIIEVMQTLQAHKV